MFSDTPLVGESRKRHRLLVTMANLRCHAAKKLAPRILSAVCFGFRYEEGMEIFDVIAALVGVLGSRIV